MKVGHQLPHIHSRKAQKHRVILDAVALGLRAESGGTLGGPVNEGLVGIANCLLHRVVTEGQGKGNFGTSMAYKAATDLVFKGLAQASGYIEPLLHAWRLTVEAGTA